MKRVLAGGSAITELRGALEEYLSVLIGLTKKGGFISSYSYILYWELFGWWFQFYAETIDDGLIEFKWRNLENGRQVRLAPSFIHYILLSKKMRSCNWVTYNKHGVQETCIANLWFELLSVVHLMAMLTLSEADSLMIPKDHSGSGSRVVSSGHIYKPTSQYLILETDFNTPPVN